MGERYDDVVAELDLAGKVRLLTGSSFFAFTGDDSIGLAPLAMSDGPTGVKGSSQSGGPPTSLLPNATLLASTWERGTLRDIGGVPRRTRRSAPGPTWSSARPSTCTAARSAAGSSSATPRTRCSPAGWPRRTCAGCRSAVSRPA